MNRKLTIIVFIVSVFVASFWLAKYLDKNGLHLPKVLSQSMHWFESLFEAEQESSDDTFINEPLENQQQVKTNYIHSEVGNRPVCKEISLGPLTYKKVGNVYTWIDDNGTPHFSDTPPEKENFEIFNYAGEKVFDYFSLDLNTENLPFDFSQKLTGKLNKLFELYGNLLDISLLKKTDINLQVVVNKTAYQKIQKAHNMPIENQSNGFYSHGSNKAYLLYTNNDQTMQTATHEATHAINRAIIGYSPKWLNEGLAEYSEGIHIMSQVSKVHSNDSWTRNGRISKQMLPINKLFSADAKEWNGKLRQQLYATSWAFIYFMMEKPNRKTMLAKVIKTEQKNICDIIENKRLEEIFGVPLNKLQRDFSIWTQTKMRSQIL